MKVITGLERLACESLPELKNLRVGLLAHAASIDSRYRHAIDIARKKFGKRLTCLFGPQHGWSAHTQDNMIEWDSARYQGLPLYSLYGKYRKPIPAMLKNLDAVIVDLQDVGTRVYTFVQTLYLVMLAAAENGKQVIVLDRPNPIGGVREGPLLDPAYASFVGLTEIPLRHGLTIGELANYYRALTNCETTVIRMKNWKRDMYYDRSGLPWVMPSPNMPTLDTAIVYPGMVLFEGTNASEGRGTTRPFEIVGSAGIRDADRFSAALNHEKITGVFFRPINFQPTFHKYCGQVCGGIQIHVTGRGRFSSVLAAAASLKLLRKTDKGFAWRKPPYEYERTKLPIDILAGGPRFREMVDNQRPLKEFRELISHDARQFSKTIRRYQLYV